MIDQRGAARALPAELASGTEHLRSYCSGRSIVDVNRCLGGLGAVNFEFSAAVVTRRFRDWHIGKRAQLLGGLFSAGNFSWTTAPSIEMLASGRRTHWHRLAWRAGSHGGWRPFAPGCVCILLLLKRHLGAVGECAVMRRVTGRVSAFASVEGVEGVAGIGAVGDLSTLGDSFSGIFSSRLSFTARVAAVCGPEAAAGPALHRLRLSRLQFRSRRPRLCLPRSHHRWSGHLACTAKIPTPPRGRFLRTTNPQRSEGHANHPIVEETNTVSETSLGGKARATISRQSAQRARCSRTVARSNSGSDRSENAVSASASGWLTAWRSDLQPLTNDIGDVLHLYNSDLTL